MGINTQSSNTQTLTETPVSKTRSLLERLEKHFPVEAAVLRSCESRLVEDEEAERRLHSEKDGARRLAAAQRLASGASRVPSQRSGAIKRVLEGKWHRPEQDEPVFNETFLNATYPHIASFNLFLDFYLKEMVKYLEPLYVDITAEPGRTDLTVAHTPAEYLKISVARVEIGRPRRTDNEDNANADPRMFPRHARCAHITYGAPLYITFAFDNTDSKKLKEKTVFSGLCPVMVRSQNCHLADLTAREMAAYAGEDINEPGGYFIVNGNERGVRFVIQQRCNYAIGMQKPRFKDRDIFYTEYAVSFRGARSDGTSTNNILFFTEDHQCVLRILLNRAEWTCPFWLVAKALMPTLQLDLVKAKFLDGAQGDRELEAEIEFLWEDMVRNDALFTDIDFEEDRYLAELGSHFYEGVASRLPPGSGYAAAGRFVINTYVLVHTNSWNGKLETLLHMWRKLWALKRGLIPAENVDSFALQEVLGPGQLFASVLKDALFNVLQLLRLAYQNEIREAKLAGDDLHSIIRSEQLFDKILERAVSGPAKALSYFCATGNIRTYQLDLQQTAGWTITADRLNMNRFIAHFRAVHRGQFFAKMRTTEVRKLIGETWGFICPVHTPDGPTCGLLLHMSQEAQVVSDPPDGSFRAKILAYLESVGIRTDFTGRVLAPASNSLTPSFPIVVDGEPVARLPRERFDEMLASFRELKVKRLHGIPAQTELCGFKNGSGAFEGIYLFSYPGRMVRPVRDVRTGRVEWIGPLAQPWLKIAGTDADVEDARRARLIQSRQIERILSAQAEGRSIDHTTFLAAMSAFNDIKKKSDEGGEGGKGGGRGSGDLEDKRKIFEALNIQDLKDLKNFQSAGDKNATGALTPPINMVQAAPLDYDYVEITPMSFLSINSSFTPLSSHNQSPRNMYQCQMLKQTMGTPFHNIPYRTDNKSYRLLFPSRPLVRNHDYNRYDMDPYASGTNAVVAVITYTGFDMEDAMIINKHSIERGAFNGMIYKTKVVEASPAGARLIDARNFVFNNSKGGGCVYEPLLDADGFPPIGAHLKRDSPLYRTEDLRVKASLGQDVAGAAGHVSTYHDDEEAYVQAIHFISPEEKYNKYAASIPCQRALITLRCVRNPIIGDKFASRAGQKGILSLLYPPEDMPFSASGICPDLLFNPHGLPSRMTIGKIIECMAGKTAAVHGCIQDSTPFREFPRQEVPYVKSETREGKEGKEEVVLKKNRWIDQGGYSGWKRRGERYMTEEEDKACVKDSSVDYYGKALLNAGYQYYGCEPLYSGVQGVEMEAHIFMGIIYYQRLRHMVSDKWQCRSIGPIDHLTRQPVKGRKRGGGVRLGEMERDAILGHGASLLLQDRFVDNSDGHYAFVCPKCGSILSPCKDVNKRRSVGGAADVSICRICEVPCRLIKTPYVFRYISNELATMGVSIKLQLTECDDAVSTDPSLNGDRSFHAGTSQKNFDYWIQE